MALRVISLLTLLAIAMHAPLAGAQEHSIQSALFENCEEAQQTFANLPPEGKSGLVDYLTRVVGLNTQAPAAPEVFAVLPNGKGMEPNPPALWQTTDAKRELRGKRCALELLTIAGSLAFDSVPQLVSLYSEQPLSDEVAVGIEETAANIAEQAHKNGQTPRDEVMDKVIPYLLSERPLVTQNLLQEYLALALPRVLTYLSNLSETDAARVVAFLREADPDGGRAMRTFIELAPKLTVDSANRLASYIPFPTKDATASLVADFAKLAAEPTNGNNVTALLAKGCVLMGGILIDPSLSATVARNPNLLRDTHLSEEEQRCLVSSIPSMATSLLGLLHSSRDDDQKRGIALLPAAIGQLDPERKNAVFARLKELSIEAKNPHRTEALLALSLFTDRRSEVNSLLSGILKTSLTLKDTQGVAPIIDATCKSLSTINTPKDLGKYGQVVVEALKKGFSSSGVVDLAAKIDSIEGAVVGLIGSSSSESAIHIITGLQTRKTFSKASLTTLAEALRQPALSAAAESLLISQGPSTIPLLRKTLLKSSTSQRLGILALLEVFGAATKSERTELANTLATSEGCSQVQVRPRAIQGVLNAPDLEPELRLKLSAKVASCLCSYEHSAAISLINTSGAALLADPAHILALLTDTKSCSFLEPVLTAATASDVLPEAIRSHILTQIIEHGSRASQMNTLESLSQKHPLAQQALPSVRKLAGAIRNDQELAYLAVLTLAKLGDTQFEWSRFIRDTIEMSETNPNYRVALDVVKTLPADVVLTEVTPALDSDNPNQVVGACRVGATLGPLAIPIVSKVWNLRDRKSPAVRYAAILALLEINPLTPDLHQGLKAILVNRYYTAAYSRPIQWRQSVAVVDLDKSSFGTLRTVHLERLLLK
jgi:hypothetical protein